MGMTGIALVVPTLGESPLLERCLDALAGEGPDELVVVHQGPDPPPTACRREGIDLLRLPTAVGFARAANAGIAASRSPLVGLVNDDAVVEAGWLSTLVAGLDDPRRAAVQGVVLRAEEPERTDGRGLGWNRWWQAVQIGLGDVPPPRTAPVREVFGVSATACLYRRQALSRAARARGRQEPFDPLLETYYEDVELAAALRGEGETAAVLPRARAVHAGGSSAAALGRRRSRLLVGNRLLVVARLLGRALWPRLPLLLTRDLVDASAGGGTLSGLAAGWGRALGLGARYVRMGRPLVPLTELTRFRA